ncbi:MAG: rod-binding protein [Caulobacterales bacterium]
MSELSGAYGITSPEAAMAAANSSPVVAALAKIKNNPNAVKVAKEFESAFLGQMLQPMFTNVDAEAPFGGGNAEGTYRPMLINEYASGLAKHGGIGIADAVLKAMVQMQMAQGEIEGIGPTGAPLPPVEGQAAAAPAVEESNDAAR